MSFSVKRIVGSAVTVILLGFNANFASADDYSEHLAKKYIETAFKRNSGLVKFAVSPRVTFICPESNCTSTVKNTRQLMPEAVFSEVSTKNPNNNEVLIFFESKNSQESSRFVELARQSYSNEVSESSWGEPPCAVTQFAQGNEVKNLVISVQLDEGEFNNTSCIMAELIRGSGGQVAGSYPKYSEQFRKMSEQAYSAFRTGANFFLRVHWSPNLKPGASKEDAKKFIIDRIR
ncbi:MAG: hypothetical protein K8F90_13435 [Hyphomicrobiales bacterium]|nr:hypothetical protein [Hyphomicrobiales bacterium]